MKKRQQLKQEKVEAGNNKIHSYLGELSEDMPAYQSSFDILIPIAEIIYKDLGDAGGRLNDYVLFQMVTGFEITRNQRLFILQSIFDLEKLHEILVESIKLLDGLKKYK